ncbi:MAG: hypothetical protein DRQ40_03475 [Gammaproteobacteria bacterium]|nr:MAG: hypothetical protein DRQ40_03475 [Gammaproteobacteria bacterium]
MSSEREYKNGKLTIEFDSNCHLEVEEARKLLTNKRWADAMWELDQHLRGLIKYGLDEASSETYDSIQQVRDKLWECLESAGVSFDKDYN